MRINNLHVSSLAVGQSGETPKVEPPRAEVAESAAAETSLHIPSAELTQWIALVKQEPEIRADILARIVERLAEGQYQTRDSALKTAQAILDAQD